MKEKNYQYTCFIKAVSGVIISSLSRSAQASSPPFLAMSLSVLAVLALMAALQSTNSGPIILAIPSAAICLAIEESQDIDANVCRADSFSSTLHDCT